MCHTQELYLNHNKIGDPGISALADALGKGAMAQCTTLVLSTNQIGDNGMISLADASSKGALPALKWLYLNDNQIGDAGISALADAVSKGALDHLTVCWRPTALSPHLETPHVHSPDSEHLFDVPYAGA